MANIDMGIYEQDLEVLKFNIEKYQIFKFYYNLVHFNVFLCFSQQELTQSKFYNFQEKVKYLNDLIDEYRFFDVKVGVSLGSCKPGTNLLFLKENIIYEK
jgi:hypothetical protein